MSKSIETKPTWVTESHKEAKNRLIFLAISIFQG